ncbi:hypothetical protein PILCRDRAFT_353377 [Piloderma croceum F 1598]|uniref:Uncharacterized protein n=1 Tax=Piloderma croceum (strain F 1598) TaxID=765440 RepID=A0A0C3C6D8_PILCF|nr:hypothetical protein PILCRDRAFT_353377 [Piloderma croceum F 1598]
MFWRRRVIKDSDGCLVFLESMYCMSKLKQVRKSLRAMGDGSRARIFLATHYWPSDDCISYARSKGYGIIQPNGSDLNVTAMASWRYSTSHQHNPVIILVAFHHNHITTATVSPMSDIFPRASRINNYLHRSHLVHDSNSINGEPTMLEN